MQGETFRSGKRVKNMIEVSHLRKQYNTLVAIEDISFTVEKGSITGFVGPNGAGKSTTLRCIVGLVKPTSGSVTIMGQDYYDIGNPSSVIGVALDAAKLHPGRSGYSTLKIASDIIGCPKIRIQEVLKECGLTMKEAKRKIKSYSLGMRQRLAIAQALLSNPSILILDEPMNGLDPKGIRWMREFLKNFAEKGGTVLISSHLLYEMEKIADHIVLINQGRIIIDKSTTELNVEGDDLENIFMKYTEPGFNYEVV